MSACAGRSPNLVLPRHPRAVQFEVRVGDAVSSLDGESLGFVEAVDPSQIRICDRDDYVYTVDRADVFWSDERGVVIAHSFADLLGSAAPGEGHPESEAIPPGQPGGHRPKPDA